MNNADYVTLVRGEHNFSDHERDETFANEADCRTCEEPFGFNTPIRIEDGVLTEHLRCYIARGGEA